jgi:hypothetical protein
VSVGRTLALVAWAAFVLPTQDARAAAQLEVRAETAPDLHLVARNAGDEPAHDVRAEVLYQHRTETAPPVDVAPGEEHEWRFPIAAPPGPGIFTVTIRLRYRDERGVARSVPLVAPVATPGATSAAVRATLETGPIAGIGHATLKLDDRDGQPVAGRAVFTLPGGLTTEPESVPAQVEPGPGTAVPLLIRNDGLPPGRYPFYAAFEYTLGGEHFAVIARAAVEVANATGQRGTRPLLVGLGALGAAIAVLVFAGRLAARRAKV